MDFGILCWEMDVMSKKEKEMSILTSVIYEGRQREFNYCSNRASHYFFFACGVPFLSTYFFYPRRVIVITW